MKTDEQDIEELDRRMNTIMDRLTKLKATVEEMKRSEQPVEKISLVIEADPSHPPEILQHLVNCISMDKNIRSIVTVHEHSSLVWSNLSCITEGSVKVGTCGSSMDAQLRLTWIWKSIGKTPVAKIINGGHSNIVGEPSIARLLARFYESLTNGILYEKFDNETILAIDHWIDMWEETSHTLDKQIMKRLDNADWLAGPGRGLKSLADIFLATKMGKKLGGKQNSWYLRTIDSMSLE